MLAAETAVEDDDERDTPYIAPPPDEVEGMFLTGAAAEYIDYLNAQNVVRLDVTRKAKAALRRATERPANTNWIADASGPMKKRIEATPFVLRDPKTLPARQWLYGKHYARKYLTATFGAGGGGKSAHSITETIAMVTGRPLLGDVVKEPLRVWSINLEDDVDEIERRFAGACLHFGIGADDIGDRLFTDSGREQEFVVARTEGRDIKIVQPVVLAIIREIQARKIDLLIVDPFVSTHSVPENDNGAIQAVAAQWVRIAHECNCGVELVHHVRKSNGLEATADDGRGAGALKDKARSVRVVNPMTLAEAEKAGIPAEDVRRYFRVDLSKFNMTAGANSEWRRFASVKLGNKPSWYEPGDEIGVVEPWRWPSAEDVVSDVPADALQGILGRLAGGNARENEQASEWAGTVVAELLRIDLTEPAGKRRVKTLLAAWLRAGVLVAVDDLDSKRQTRKFIRVPSAPPPPKSGGAGVGQGAADSIHEPAPPPPTLRSRWGGGAKENGEVPGGAAGGANPTHARDTEPDDDELTDDKIAFLKQSRQAADPAFGATP